jgi:UDP-2,3-diacylglucosamine pyrophosphatase LpxH
VGEGVVSHKESLLVLSDVHLGSDLNDRPSTRIRRSSRIDRDLVELIQHYRNTPPKGDRWRLVVAGDFIDFIGMTILPADVPLATAPSEEEQEHGLGNAADHARIKVQRVAARHPDVFRALAGWVEAGQALTFVHGNHDVELYWDEVKTELVEQLFAVASEGTDRAAFASRIDFAPWFFYADGLAYIEHGHQYDEFCATETFMAPLSPADPRRIRRGFCEVLLRFVVRQTRGLKEHGHEQMGVVDYIKFGWRLGARGMARLLVRFILAVRELFRVYGEQFLDTARGLKDEHERRMALLAEARKIGIGKLRALAALQAPPVTRSIHGILASVLLDRVALALACAMLLLVAAIVFGLRGGHYFWFVGPCILASWLLTHRYLSRRRKVDPDELLVERAAKLSRLFPAAFVVMGHTHVPMRVPVGDQTTYINVGSWAEEEGEDGRVSALQRAARTHLVISRDESGPVAEFLAWEPESGPKRFSMMRLPAAEQVDKAG